LVPLFGFSILKSYFGGFVLSIFNDALVAEVVEIFLGKIIKEVYIKDEGIIMIDP
jgi:hypothetical protein